MTAWVVFIVQAAALIVWVSYWLECRHIQRRRTLAKLPQVAQMDEAVLLGPVSAWVAEGEARAVYEWEAKHPTPHVPQKPDCDDCEWVEITSLGQLHRDYARSYPCDKHGGLLPQPEPPADISGFRMVEIR